MALKLFCSEYARPADVRQRDHRTLLRLVAVAACCAVSFACTKEERSCVEDGSCGCPDGGLTDDGGGVAPLPFRYALFVDFSEIGPEPLSYLSGTDICGVVADCDGVLHQGVRAVLDSGVRGDCASDDACAAGVNRDDARAALDDGARCGLSGERSDFVSLGALGDLIVEFDVDLRGCSLEVREYPGDDGLAEGFDVYACQTPEPTGCGCTLVLQSVSPARDVTVDVPPR